MKAAAAGPPRGSAILADPMVSSDITHGTPTSCIFKATQTPSSEATMVKTVRLVTTNEWGYRSGPPVIAKSRPLGDQLSPDGPSGAWPGRIRPPPGSTSPKDHRMAQADDPNSSTTGRVKSVRVDVTSPGQGTASRHRQRPAIRPPADPDLRRGQGASRSGQPHGRQTATRVRRPVQVDRWPTGSASGWASRVRRWTIRSGPWPRPPASPESRAEILVVENRRSTRARKGERSRKPLGAWLTRVKRSIALGHATGRGPRWSRRPPAVPAEVAGSDPGVEKDLKSSTALMSTPSPDGGDVMGGPRVLDKIGAIETCSRRSTSSWSAGR